MQNFKNNTSKKVNFEKLNLSYHKSEIIILQKQEGNHNSFFLFTIKVI